MVNFVYYATEFLLQRKFRLAIITKYYKSYNSPALNIAAEPLDLQFPPLENIEEAALPPQRGNSADHSTWVPVFTEASASSFRIYPNCHKAIE